jgi:hypothetical protein
MTAAPDIQVRWLGVCLDCADAGELATFYARLLGWKIKDGDGGGWIFVEGPVGSMGLSCQAEPWYEPPVWPEEPERQTKMMHFEIQADDIDAAVAHAVALGAREAEPQPPDRSPDQLRVMLDPAGHPFCLCTH